MDTGIRNLVIGEEGKGRLLLQVCVEGIAKELGRAF